MCDEHGKKTKNPKGGQRKPRDWDEYSNTQRAQMVSEHLPPIHEVPQEVPKLDRHQIVVRSYVGGLVKSFERRAA